MSAPALVKPISESSALARTSTLYELDEELQRLMNQALDEEADGAVKPETELALRAYFEATVTKIDRIAEFIKYCKAEATIAGIEKDRIAARIAGFERLSDRTKQMLKWFMETRGQVKFPGKLNTIRLQNNPESLEITDEAKVPDDYRVAVVTMPLQAWRELAPLVSPDTPCDVQPQLDGAAIKAMLKTLVDATGTDGEPVKEPAKVPGAKLTRGSHIRIQ